MRAHMAPGHRIAIKTYEDQSDPRDFGAAPRRMESLRLFMLAQDVGQARLEMQISAEPRGTGELGDYARCAQVTLFPRVASLCLGVGEPYLSYRELSMLQTAREIALIADVGDKRGLLQERFGEIDWMRLVGHSSFEDWAAAGAHHPLYDRPDLR